MNCTNRLEWFASLAESDPEFRDELDRLRRLAAGEDRGGYERAKTGPLTEWERFDDLLDAFRSFERQPQRERAHRDKDASAGWSHVRHYLRGCVKLARRWFRDERVAPRIHDCIRRSGYRVEVSGLDSPTDFPEGPLASTIAAHMTHTPWLQATRGAEQTMYRYTGPAHRARDGEGDRIFIL